MHAGGALVVLCRYLHHKRRKQDLRWRRRKQQLQQTQTQRPRSGGGGGPAGRLVPSLLSRLTSGSSLCAFPWPFSHRSHKGLDKGHDTDWDSLPRQAKAGGLSGWLARGGGGCGCGCGAFLPSSCGEAAARLRSADMCPAVWAYILVMAGALMYLVGAARRKIQEGAGGSADALGCGWDSRAGLLPGRFSKA